MKSIKLKHFVNIVIYIITVFCLLSFMFRFGFDYLNFQQTFSVSVLFIVAFISYNEWQTSNALKDIEKILKEIQDREVGSSGSPKK